MLEQGQKYTIQTSNKTLTEATVIGAGKRLSGSRFYLFETDGGVIYMKNAAEVEPQLQGKSITMAPSEKTQQG